MPLMPTGFFKRFSFRWTLLVFMVAALSAALYFALAGRGDAFDSSRPFKMGFGRGSELEGFDTVSIADDGSAILCRRRRSGEYWERAELRLTPAQMRGIGESIVRHELSKLKKEYHGGAVDGTQWRLWFRQNGYKKASYFDNEFPPGVVAFSEELDRLLVVAGAEEVSWQNIGRDRTHDREFWSALEY